MEAIFSIFTILRDNYLEVRCIRGPLLYELKLKLESKALEQQHLAPTTLAPDVFSGITENDASAIFPSG